MSHLQQTMRILSMLQDVPIKDVSFVSKDELFSFPLQNRTTSNRQKRLSLEFLKKIPFGTILSKIVKIGAPFLYQNFEPFVQMGKHLISYQNIKKPPLHLKFKASSNISDPDALKLHQKNNIFSLEIKEKFDQIHSITTPGLFQASELYRAAFLLNYSYRRIMSTIPYEIFEILRNHIQYSNINNIKAKIQQEGSLLFLHYIFDADVPDEKIEEFTFSAFPIAMKNEEILQYSVPKKYSPLQRTLQKTDLCLKSLIYGKDIDIQSTCSLEATKNTNIITHLYKYLDREYVLIKGPSQIKAKCQNQPSRFFEIKKQYGIFVLGGGCKLDVSLHNLQGSFTSHPMVENYSYLKLLYQYDLKHLWSHKNYTNIGLSITFSFVIFFSIIAIFVILYGFKFHTKYKISFQNSLPRLHRTDNTVRQDSVQ